MSDDVSRLSRTRTSDLSREQRGLVKLKLAQSHVTRIHFQGQNIKGQLAGGGHIVAASRTACIYEPISDK